MVRLNQVPFNDLVILSCGHWLYTNLTAIESGALDWTHVTPEFGCVRCHGNTQAIAIIDVYNPTGSLIDHAALANA